MKRLFVFRNSQGCFLQEFRAVHAAAAWRQFRRRWHNCGGVTCREVEP